MAPHELEILIPCRSRAPGDDNPIPVKEGARYRIIAKSDPLRLGNIEKLIQGQELEKRAAYGWQDKLSWQLQDNNFKLQDPAQFRSPDPLVRPQPQFASQCVTTQPQLTPPRSQPQFAFVY